MPDGPSPALAFDLRVTHRALAVSRILYHAALFWLVLDMWRWREAAFARDRAAAEMLLPLALCVNGLLVLGLWTRPALVVNAVLLRALFALCLDPYTVDEVAENTSLLLAFSPAPLCLSLDSLRARRSEPERLLPVPFVLLMFSALALVYADGLRHKLASTIWRQGSAFWLGAALPHFSTGLLPQWTEVGWLMRACTYAALAYEALFPLVLARRVRPVLAATGLMVHVGSGIFMALPQFALLMSGLVAMFAPWRPPAEHGRVQPAPAGRALSLSAGGLILLMLAGQLSLNLSPMRPRNLLCRVLGLHPRIIFVDWHFKLPGPLVRFTAVGERGETPIPSFDRHGYPTVNDRYWKLFGFTARATGVWQEPADRYVRCWFGRSGLPFARVRAYCRDVRPRSLGLDFSADDDERARPWTLCGEIVLLGGPATGSRAVSSDR